MGPLCPRPCSNHTQKAYERYQEHLMGPPTDPRPSGSARKKPPKATAVKTSSVHEDLNPKAKM
ncbi:unnamed protein product [Staurois parvus]|uniref:Uncharacterized protein n=1 Tax=Staurois parvus TaxID=386267 RepID=A0ABN9BUD7_9NEOB|nr:unnamed protein product [Staurois parvus]